MALRRRQGVKSQHNRRLDTRTNQGANSVRFEDEQPDTQAAARNKTFVKTANEAIPEEGTEDETADMLRAEDVKEEFLVCGICTREYSEEVHVPRILPCLHTFCEQCLKKCSKPQSIDCPLCKQEHLLPKGNISGFAKDTTRRNLIDFIKVRRRSSEILCKDCPEDQTACDFCKECYIFMCVECTRAHRRSLASRKHNVVTIKDLQNSGIEVFKRKLVCTKPGHEGQQLAFYCTKPGCETSICTACTVCDHEKAKGHVIINVQDIYKVKKQELNQVFKTLDSEITSAKAALHQMEQELLNIDIKELEVEKEIDDAFEVCVTILTKRQQQLKLNLAAVCEEKKTGVQRHVEMLENYLDSAANAKDFSLHVLNHTDPTEFVPLHATLSQRLKTMAELKFDKQSVEVESPMFDNKKMESDFQDYTSTLGKLTTQVHQRHLSLSRSHTHIGMSSASTTRQEQDRRFGDILCPGFSYDAESVHQYREISDNRRVLRNFATTHRHPNMHGVGRRLKKYRGVIASRAFHVPGKFYYELFISYQITKPLDNINFVFEAAVSRRSEIDSGYYVYDQAHAWSFCGQHCDTHKQVCIWCRHYGYSLAHVPLTASSAGTTLERTFGFLLDADRGHITVLDVSRQRKIHTFQGVNYTGGLWPVFGCHWPSKVKLEMKLRTGRDIESLPSLIQET